jgi:flagellar motor switch protein FliN
MEPFQEIEGFSDLRLEVEAQLDQTVMSLRDIMNLSPEAVIRLSKPAGDSIDVLVGGSVVCSGDIIVVNDFLAVRITDFREED